jgi:hypothetical protein
VFAGDAPANPWRPKTIPETAADSSAFEVLICFLSVSAEDRCTGRERAVRGLLSTHAPKLVQEINWRKPSAGNPASCAGNEMACAALPAEQAQSLVALAWTGQNSSRPILETHVQLLCFSPPWSRSSHRSPRCRGRRV